jgi:hypothetical protein
MARKAAARTEAAADALLTWLGQRDGSRPPALAHPLTSAADAGSAGEDAAAVARGDASRQFVALSASHTIRPSIAPAHADWLFHHLRIVGPAAALAAFRRDAAGAGIIPWHLDLNRMEEDFFLKLAAPKGQARTLSLDGARLLASELRDAVARRHARAIAQVGRSQACRFDLHSLVPVPGDILRLGPDHPDALRWLWTHWGTTDALRHVALAPDPNGRAPETEATVVSISFWSADWTPWLALATVQSRFPGLCFEVQPRYDLA